MRGDKDLWDLIFFLSDVSSKDSETEIFIAVYVSDFFFFPFKERPHYLWYHCAKKWFIARQKITSTQLCILIYYVS